MQSSRNNFPQKSHGSSSSSSSYSNNTLNFSIGNTPYSFQPALPPQQSSRVTQGYSSLNTTSFSSSAVNTHYAQHVVNDNFDPNQNNSESESEQLRRQLALREQELKLKDQELKVLQQRLDLEKRKLARKEPAFVGNNDQAPETTKRQRITSNNARTSTYSNSGAQGSTFAIEQTSILNNNSGVYRDHQSNPDSMRLDRDNSDSCPLLRLAQAIHPIPHDRQIPVLAEALIQMFGKDQLSSLLNSNSAGSDNLDQSATREVSSSLEATVLANNANSRERQSLSQSQPRVDMQANPILNSNSVVSSTSSYLPNNNVEAQSILNPGSGRSFSASIVSTEISNEDLVDAFLAYPHAVQLSLLTAVYDDLFQNNRPISHLGVEAAQVQALHASTSTSDGISSFNSSMTQSSAQPLQVVASQESSSSSSNSSSSSSSASRRGVVSNNESDITVTESVPAEVLRFLNKYSYSQDLKTRFLTLRNKIQTPSRCQLASRDLPGAEVRFAIVECYKEMRDANCLLKSIPIASRPGMKQETFCKEFSDNMNITLQALRTLTSWVWNHEKMKKQVQQPDNQSSSARHRIQRTVDLNRHHQSVIKSRSQANSSLFVSNDPNSNTLSSNANQWTNSSDSRSTQNVSEEQAEIPSSYGDLYNDSVNQRTNANANANAVNNISGSAAIISSLQFHASVPSQLPPSFDLDGDIAGSSTASFGNVLLPSLFASDRPASPRDFSIGAASNDSRGWFSDNSNSTSFFSSVSPPSPRDGSNVVGLFSGDGQEDDPFNLRI